MTDTPTIPPAPTSQPDGVPMTLQHLHNPTAERRVYDVAGHAVDPHTTVDAAPDDVTLELIAQELLIDNGPIEPEPAPVASALTKKKETP